ncbi:MAG TPA: queuosine precursor transporter, partial [Bellilinea sp.]|nr:queuosine precursor transporter [Bellilinea sp.]
VFGDVLTEVYGFKRSRKVIWTGFVMLAFSALILWLVRVLPGEATWQQYAGQGAYDAILGGMTSGGIVLASLAAYLVGEFANSIVLSKMKVATKGRHLWMRTIGSTLIGQALDTLIFISIASLFGVFPWSLFATLVLTNYLFKVIIEVLLTPLTYAVVNWLKNKEQGAHFFYDDIYSPL